MEMVIVRLALWAATKAANKLGWIVAPFLVFAPLLLIFGLLALVGPVAADEGSPLTACDGSSFVLSSSGGAVGVDDDQRANAQTIISVGQEMSVPVYGWIVAVATALGESGLRNLDHGDRDSLGLFQQRPSQGWGTPEQIRDPRYAAGQFFAHLLAVPKWESSRSR